MRSICYSILALLALLLPSACFSMSLTFDALVKEIYETNVNPLLSGAGRPFAGDQRERHLPAAAKISTTAAKTYALSGTDASDFYTSLNASAGVASIIGPETDLSFRAELERQQFQRFSELNATTVGLRGVVVKQFSDIHSMSLGVNGRRSEYSLDALTGSGFSANLGLRQQTASRFCLDEAVLYERYRAEEDINFAGNGLSLQAGYRFSPALTSALSYGLLKRKFQNDDWIMLHSIAASGAWEPIRHFSIFASLEYQRYESRPAFSRASNSIAAVGIGCSY